MATYGLRIAAPFAPVARLYVVSTRSVSGSTWRCFGRRSRPSAAILALSATTLVSYGCLYYSFGVVVHDLSKDLGLSVARASIAFTASTATSALLTPLVGRLLDVVRPARPMLIGSLVAVAGLLAASQARGLEHLVAAWTVLGAVVPLTSYDPAFAYVVRTVRRRDRQRAFVLVTVVGGLASTVFVPVLGVASSHWSWRAALGVAALSVLVINAPVHFLLVRQERAQQASLPRSDRTASLPTRRRFLTTRAGATIAAMLACQGIVLGAVATYLLAALLDKDVPRESAYMAASLMGLAAIAGRLLSGGARAESRLPTILAVAFCAQSMALAWLAAGQVHAVCLLLASALVGGAGGMATLARPQLVTHYVQDAGFASANGKLSGVSMVAKAAGPAVGGVTLAIDGTYGLLWASLCAISVSSTVIWSLPQRPGSR